MCEAIRLEYNVDGDDFSSAGIASEQVKMHLKKLGIPSEIVRRVAISMYEAEINLVIHGGGGKAIVDIYPDKIVMQLVDHGKGIEDIELAMQEGYTTAPDNIRALGFGAGMGLPNMKKYSDEIDVKSKVGEGTTVTMTIYVKD